MTNGVWEDEDARKFYEDLPDLSVLVPGILLENDSARKAATTTSGTDEDAAAEAEQEQLAPEKDTAAEDGQTEAAEETNEEDADVDPSELVDKALE